MFLLLDEDDQGIADFPVRGFQESRFFVDYVLNADEGLAK